MKFILILACLALYAAHTFAQEGCAGRPRRQNCFGPRDDGTGERGCEWNAKDLWYYNQASNDCLPMKYLGCGGNANRYCTREDCLFRCKPPV